MKGWISPRTASKINVPRLSKVRGWIGDGDDFSLFLDLGIQWGAAERHIDGMLILIYPLVN